MHILCVNTTRSFQLFAFFRLKVFSPFFLFTWKNKMEIREIFHIAKFEEVQNRKDYYCLLCVVR